MKLARRYLKSRRGAIGLFIAFALIFAASFALYRLPLAAVLYPALLCGLLGAGYLAHDFARARRRHRVLEDLTRLEAGLPERLPEVPGVEAADYRALAALLARRQRETRDRAEADMRAQCH